MKKVYLIGALLSFGLLAEAQSFMRFEDKAFNFGAKVGFNATFPVINSLSINGKEAENIDIEYKVGYLAAVFCRVNIERFFLQPSFSWYRSEGNIRFSIPQSLPENNMMSNTSATTDLLMMKTSSLEVPIMVGYNLVKKGPYGLSLMVGPKLKYNYKIAYTVESSTTHVEYVNDNTPFGVNIATGVGVSIGRLFFNNNGRIETHTNHSGGIQGGISNGQDIYFRVVFKPIATLLMEQETVNIDGVDTTLKARGRHDACVLPRAVPIVEAMAAMTILDYYLLDKTTQL